jgi:hypothetical protein
MNLRQHDIGFGVDKEALVLHWGKLSWVAQHEDLGPEAEQILGERLADHRNFIDN